ncbi:hypothetical protein LZ198_04955 [Myxococcus sp. K15C18031901]|uniref:hypothetical protein n=1 Tax=Myxococcus dinghuensis TaxID=2906761 RepID=UPI0020A7EAE4|nr:hypothetical protein [Myxococcus dinghuensis]MCP3098226.1 hypothetical protein [Myxococcus dinghuensis]
MHGNPHAQGRRGPWVENSELEVALEAIHEQPDCGRLEESFGGFFAQVGSLPALLARLRSAGLVTMDGAHVRLTTAGRVLRNLEPLHPPRVPAPKSDYGRWVLWAGPRQPVGDPPAVPINSLGLHIQWLEQCLARVPLDKRVQDVLVSYHRFLVDTLGPAGEREVLAFNAPGPLAEAVETLLELEDLDLEFLQRNSPLTNEGLRVLHSALGSPLAPSQALFHLVWGW